MLRRIKATPSSPTAPTRTVATPNSGTVLGIWMFDELELLPAHPSVTPAQPPDTVVPAVHVMVAVLVCPEVTRPPQVEGMPNVYSPLPPKDEHEVALSVAWVVAVNVMAMQTVPEVAALFISSMKLSVPAPIFV